MIVRYLTQNDITEHDKISSQAFSYSCEIGDPASVLPAEKVLGAFDDDNKTLFADMEILDKSCYYGSGLLTCAAVGGVAAKPEHRGKGAVRELFRRFMSDGGYDISILYPFSEDYYRKLGYERVGSSISAEIPFAELSGVTRNNDVTLYEGDGAAKLLDIYNRCAASYSLCFVRNSAEAFSANPYLSQKYTYIYKDGAFATIQVDRKSSTVIVSEVYYDSPASMLGILGFLRNFEGNQQRVRFCKLPANTPLLSVIRNLNHCEIRLMCTGAAAVLNAAKVLETHRYPVQSGSFTAEICGEVFGVNVSGGRAEAEILSSAAPDVVMSRNAASRILLGGAGDPELIPGLSVNNPQSDFFRMFPEQIPFFTDSF